MPPPTSLNHGTTLPAFTSSGSLISKILYGFLSVPGATALCPYGVPSGKVNVSQSLPYLSITVQVSTLSHHIEQ